jgi:hypothetical protein
MGDTSLSVPLHQVCHVPSIAPCHSVFLSHCTSCVTQNVNCRVARWFAFLQDYNLVIQHVPGKLHAAADMLSCPPTEDKGENDNTNLTLLPLSVFINNMYLGNSTGMGYPNRSRVRVCTGAGTGHRIMTHDNPQDGYVPARTHKFIQPQFHPKSAFIPILLHRCLIHAAHLLTLDYVVSCRPPQSSRRKPPPQRVPPSITPSPMPSQPLPSPNQRQVRPRNACSRRTAIHPLSFLHRLWCHSRAHAKNQARSLWHVPLLIALLISCSSPSPSTNTTVTPTTSHIPSQSQFRSSESLL